MPELPQGLADDRHAALRRRRVEPWGRRAFLHVLLAAVAAALAGAVGQRASSTVAAEPAARLAVRAPQVVRGGLLFQARIEVRARRAVEHPRLVLDEGWLSGLQVNTIEPSPASEASRDGRLVLSYDALDPGDRLVVYLQFQLDPTSVGRTRNDVELDDATTRLAVVHRTLRRLP
jgi:hypothetical protein